MHSPCNLPPIFWDNHVDKSVSVQSMAHKCLIYKGQQCTACFLSNPDSVISNDNRVCFYPLLCAQSFL